MEGGGRSGERQISIGGQKNPKNAGVSLGRIDRRPRRFETVRCNKSQTIFTLGLLSPEQPLKSKYARSRAAEPGGTAAAEIEQRRLCRGGGEKKKEKEKR